MSGCHMCGACCTEISISGDIPGMGSKPAGVRCIHLNEQNLCDLFGHDSRPAVCSGFQAEPAFCGTNGEEAVIRIRLIEQETKPN